MSQIALVSNQHNDDVGISVIPQFLEPSRDILVGLVLADVVNEQGSHSAAVVGGGNGAVSLLAGGIPDLGLDRLGVDLDGPGGELDTDGRLGVEVELVSSESAEKVGFSDSRVSDQHDCRFEGVSKRSALRGSLGLGGGLRGWVTAPLKRNYTGELVSNAVGDEGGA